MAKNALEKSLLRKKCLKIRKSLTEEQVELKSREIHKKLFHLPEFINAKVIHTYVSIEKMNEVSTREIIQYSFDQQKRIVVPKMEREGVLTHHEINSIDDLEKNNWGVGEPRVANLFPTEKLSIVIVPMVAADYLKNRLGYGMGFYDRFLSSINTYNVGLAYDCLLSKNTLPVEAFDKKMDVILTESKKLL